jgi:hypothetical protein
MPSLHWKRTATQTINIETAAYKSEQEFEQDVFQTPEVLGDIYLLKRQVRGGAKRGIPDIVGIDIDGRICIVEMKNIPIDATVIPQLLEYAIWAESNPDSIKSLWLEAKKRPADREINWETPEVRVIVVAPSVDKETLDHVNKVNYQIDLIEITRWRNGSQTWLLVNRLEPPPAKKNRPVTGFVNYDRLTYEERYDPQAVRAYIETCDSLQKLAISHKWPVERKFNKHYCGFKIGNYIVFGVKWTNRKAFGVFIKVSEAVARRERLEKYDYRYESQWNNALYRTKGNVFKAAALRPLLEKAVKARLA